jgi:hypothetical protein
MGKKNTLSLMGGKKPYDYTLVVGYKGEYPTEEGRRSKPFPVAGVAAMLNSGIIGGKTNSIETGKRGRPKRKKWPYEKNVLDRKGRNSVNKRIADAMKDLISGKISSAYYPLVKLGDEIKGELKSEIWSMVSPKLSEKTIENRERRGVPYSEKPLIETQRLVNSIFVKVFKTETAMDIKHGFNKNYEFAKIPKAKYKDRNSFESYEEGENLKTSWRGDNNMFNGVR